MAFYQILLSIISNTIHSTDAAMDSPGVHIGASGGVCALDRCECFAEAASCCTPFGPSYGPTWTNGTLTRNECTNHFWYFEISPSTRHTTREITLKLFPSGYAQQTTVFYTIKAYGMISKSDFRNIGNWTNYVDPLNNHSEISNLMLYPNKLNIKVNTSFNGTLTIPSGFSEGDIVLDISSNRTCQVGESGSNCITFDECLSNSLGFGLFITSCNTVANYTCRPVYPYVLWIQIAKSHELCAILYPPIPTPYPSRNPTMPTLPTMTTTSAPTNSPTTERDGTTNHAIFVKVYAQNHMFTITISFFMMQIGLN